MFITSFEEALAASPPKVKEYLHKLQKKHNEINENFINRCRTLRLSSSPTIELDELLDKEFSLFDDLFNV